MSCVCFLLACLCLLTSYKKEYEFVTVKVSFSLESIENKIYQRRIFYLFVISCKHWWDEKLDRKQANFRSNIHTPERQSYRDSVTCQGDYNTGILVIKLLILFGIFINVCGWKITPSLLFTPSLFFRRVA